MDIPVKVKTDLYKISTEDRYLKMRRYVESEETTYVLKGGLTDSHWVTTLSITIGAGGDTIGAQVYFADGVPSNSLGKDEDAYFKTDIPRKAYKKVSNTWNEQMEFSDGSKFRFGNGVPDNAVGADDDTYLDKDTGKIYLRAAGVYGEQFQSESLTNKTSDTSSNNDDDYASTAFVHTAIGEAVTGLYDDRGNYDASVNTFPATGGSGVAGAILKGDIWTISVPGTLGGQAVIVQQSVRALVDAPGQTAGNWSISVGSSEVPDASESVKGKAQLATQAIIENEATTNDTDIVTPKKWWFGFARALALSWTWAAKQIFTTAPRFSSTTASQYLKVDATKDLTSVATIPAADIDGLTLAITTAAPAETAATLASLINAATTKATPVDADIIAILDSAASNVLKKVTWASLKATIGSFTVATAAEVNTGTDNTKGVTPLAINDSDYLKRTFAKISGTTTGTATAYILGLTPVLTAYATNQLVIVTFNLTSGASPTINIDGLGAKTLLRLDGTSIQAGDLVAGIKYVMVYNGTSFQMVGGLPGSFIQNGVASQTANFYITGNGRIDTSLGIGLAAAASFFFAVGANTAAKASLLLTPSATDYTGTTSGSIWNNAGELRFLEGTIQNRLVKWLNNSLGVSDGSYMAEFNAQGDLGAVNKIEPRRIFDSDIIAAIVAASWSSNRATITPASSKVMNAGKYYYDATYFYTALADNYIQRI